MQQQEIGESDAFKDLEQMVSREAETRDLNQKLNDALSLSNKETEAYKTQFLAAQHDFSELTQRLREGETTQPASVVSADNDNGIGLLSPLPTSRREDGLIASKLKRIDTVLFYMRFLSFV